MSGFFAWVYRKSQLSDTGWSIHAPYSVPYPRGSFSYYFPTFYVTYRMLYWQRLSHIPPPQPWYFPLEKRWGLQCHSCYTLNHDILLTPNTQVNYVSFSDRFQVHIWLVRYIYNKIVNTQATLITSIFLIPGATTFNIFSQYFSSVYNIFVGSITYLWKSVTSYQVVALKTGGYNSTLYQEYCQNIYTCCTPNQMGFYWKN